MDDGKLLTLEQVCEDGGEGGDGEASHPGASRMSTVSGSQLLNLSGRRPLMVSGKRLGTDSISRVHVRII